MRKELLLLAVCLGTVTLLSSGMQSVTGYYGNPGGYGFHDIQYGLLRLSIGITAGGVLAMAFLMRKAGRLIG